MATATITGLALLVLALITTTTGVGDLTSAVIDWPHRRSR